MTAARIPHHGPRDNANHSRAINSGHAGGSNQVAVEQGRRRRARDFHEAFHFALVFLVKRGVEVVGLVAGHGYDIAVVRATVDGVVGPSNHNDLVVLLVGMPDTDLVAYDAGPYRRVRHVGLQLGRPVEEARVRGAEAIPVVPRFPGDETAPAAGVGEFHLEVQLVIPVGLGFISVEVVSVRAVGDALEREFFHAALGSISAFRSPAHQQYDLGIIGMEGLDASGRARAVPGTADSQAANHPLRFPKA